MKSNRWSNGWSNEEGISLNSLIDVLFILLLFLMISINMKPESYLDLQLPSIDSSENSAGNDSSLVIELSDKRQVYVKSDSKQSEDFNLDQLTTHRNHLTDLCSNEKRVLLRVDQNVIYQDLVELLDVLRNCSNADLAIEKSNFKIR
ncbi:MAG: biopolymer transporter ExbD [Leptonema sp. (in: Bacteria)]|nr:biopolymer transporter ExbD [Leptonema sp. (in: bacteria)]